MDQQKAKSKIRATKSQYLWPEAKVSRADLADYLGRIAPHLKKYLHERPVQFLCAPHGVVSQAHYVWTRMGKVDSRETLMACADLNAVEIHTMNLRLDKPHHPDFIFLEMTPADDSPNATQDLLKVFRFAQELFDELGLSRFWKLSGVPGGGLHVLLPLKRRYSAAVVFDFSKMLAEMIYERAPQISVLKSSQNSASSRIRIDYHQNHFHYLNVAMFSPRRTLTPFISLPVSAEFLNEQITKRSNALPLFGFDISDAALREGAQVVSSTLAHPNDLEPAFVAIEEMAQIAL